MVGVPCVYYQHSDRASCGERSSGTSAVPRARAAYLLYLHRRDAMFPSGWRNVVRQQLPGARPARRPRSLQPRCEELEARCQPSVFTFSTGNPDGRMATASRPPNGAAFEIESADDFLLTTETQINSATFT